jgi:hypothetical protein
MLDTLGWMVSWYLSNRIFRSPKYYKGFHGRLVPLSSGSHNWTGLDRASNSPIWPTGGHITFSGGTQETWEIAFSSLQNAEESINESKLRLNRGSHDNWRTTFSDGQMPKRQNECRRVTYRKQDTLDPRFKWTLKINIFRWAKWSSYRGKEDFRKGISTTTTEAPFQIYLSFFIIL